ncbi:sorting nexin-1-like isoform X1 [Salvelinus fontinalis]|uniref:sorting nexin-1-like isoform X1 n=2 Tax=Salvelinus fontinalis TaxID=8038 RepID=UPI002486099F|nr:sorting nexin-1-like isoform X1 [Salvelinus fontinalis]
MAASSPRNPSLPGAENQDPLSEMADEDSDEGEDIFVGNSNPVAESFQPDTANGEEPADLFSEEETSTAVNSSITTFKSNGVHSDNENDLFAEVSVELSMENPSTTAKTSGAEFTPSLTLSATQPRSMEQVGYNRTSATQPRSMEQVGYNRTSATQPRSMEQVGYNRTSATQPRSMEQVGYNRTSATQPRSMEQLEEDKDEDSFDMDVAVTNPEKIGDGMNAYMAYKVSTRTTLPMFRNRTFSVWRRFSDFLGLYEKLSVKHSLNGCIIPPPPEKSVVGMTKVKVGKEDSSSADFVERRRAALERYLQRVVCHPSLLQDPDVREFLERDELPRAVGTHTLSGAGFLKMINRASDAVSKMTIKISYSDAWFDNKLQEVECEDLQLRKLHAVVDSLVNHRKELCGNTAVFAKSMAMLGNSEDNTALSRALSQLAEVEDKMETLHQEQAASDFFILAELLADYIRLLGAVRGCFEQRMKTWQRWQEAQSTLQKKREVEAKLLWANKPDKLQQAKEEITEWEGKVTQYERDFDRISVTVRKEFLRFEKEKSKDFKSQIVKYLESLLQSQQRLVMFWEAFLPEAKAIA